MRIKNIIKQHILKFWTGVLLVQIFWFYLCSKVDFLTRFFERFFEFQKRLHQNLFAIFPFSVGDILYLALGIALLFVLIKIFKKSSRLHYIKIFLIGVNIFYFTYQLFWGMLYFKEPIINNFTKVENPEKEAKVLALKYLELCKSTRNLVSENNAGVFVINDLIGIKKEIIHQQTNLPSFISGNKSTGILALKPSLYKGVMSYTGILGYYNPFTSEAQFNSELPSTYIPFTLAHESMHQFGIAREQEANFTAYLIGKNSENLDLKYSTEYYVLKSLLGSLKEKDPEFVKKIIASYSPAMKRDRAIEISFRKKHEGLLTTIFGFTNDLFLKSNQQEGSITYSYFVDLLLRYERHHLK